MLEMHPTNGKIKDPRKIARGPTIRSYFYERHGLARSASAVVEGSWPVEIDPSPFTFITWQAKAQAVWIKKRKYLVPREISKAYTWDTVNKIVTTTPQIHYESGRPIGDSEKILVAKLKQLSQLKASQTALPKDVWLAYLEGTLEPETLEDDTLAERIAGKVGERLKTKPSKTAVRNAYANFLSQVGTFVLEDPNLTGKATNGHASFVAKPKVRTVVSESVAEIKTEITEKASDNNSKKSGEAPDNKRKQPDEASVNERKSNAEKSLNKRRKRELTDEESREQSMKKFKKGHKEWMESRPTGCFSAKDWEFFFQVYEKIGKHFGRALGNHLHRNTQG